MASPMRFVYPGAVYHVMARRDGGKVIFIEKEDPLLFFHGLSRVCGSHGWRLYAWVLLGNHFHLLLETPGPSLVEEMRILLGTFRAGLEPARPAPRARVSRALQVGPGRGRMGVQSVPVPGVADYIHPNPARAGLAGESHGKLVDYKWSSLPVYLRGRGPAWLRFDRVSAAFELAKDGRSRSANVIELAMTRISSCLKCL